MNFCTYCNEEIFSIKKHWITNRHRDNVRLEIIDRIKKEKEMRFGRKKLRVARNPMRSRFSRTIRVKRANSKGTNK